MVSWCCFTAPVKAQTVDAAYGVAVSRTWSIKAEVNRVFIYSPEYSGCIVLGWREVGRVSSNVGRVLVRDIDWMLLGRSDRVIKLSWWV